MSKRYRITMPGGCHNRRIQTFSQRNRGIVAICIFNAAASNNHRSVSRRQKRGGLFNLFIASLWQAHIPIVLRLWFAIKFSLPRQHITRQIDLNWPTARRQSRSKSFTENFWHPIS